ncbi:MAG: SHOCT domain-containing protein [Candidatus Saccharimonadales bacterium]
MVEQFAQMMYRDDFPMTIHATNATDDRWFTLVGLLVFSAIVGVILLVVYKIATKPAASQGNNPLDIARERYAKGEISKEEFTEIKKELSSK